MRLQTLAMLLVTTLAASGHGAQPNRGGASAPRLRIELDLGPGHQRRALPLHARRQELAESLLTPHCARGARILELVPELLEVTALRRLQGALAAGGASPRLTLVLHANDHLAGALQALDLRPRGPGSWELHLGEGWLRWSGWSPEAALEALVRETARAGAPALASQEDTAAEATSASEQARRDFAAGWFDFLAVRHSQGPRARALRAPLSSASAPRERIARALLALEARLGPRSLGVAWRRARARRALELPGYLRQLAGLAGVQRAEVVAAVAQAWSDLAGTAEVARELAGALEA